MPVYDKGPFLQKTQRELASDERICWPEQWMTMAYTIARRSHDEKIKVGAVIVSDDNAVVYSQGYNGNVRGGPHKRASIENDKSGFLHAEENAICKCPYHTYTSKIMYSTVSPCLMCAKRIVNTNISVIVYDEMFRDQSGIELFRELGCIEVYSLVELIGDTNYAAFRSIVDVIKERTSGCAFNEKIS